MKNIFIPILLLLNLHSALQHSSFPGMPTQMEISTNNQNILNPVTIQYMDQDKIIQQGYNRPVTRSADWFEAGNPDKIKNVSKVDSDSRPRVFFNKPMEEQNFTLDDVWKLSTGSPTISQQISDLSWDYDEFRSNVRLGTYSGTQMGSRFITLNGRTDLRHGMLAFTYQLNNVLNTDKTAILADMAAKGEMDESDFNAAYGAIEAAGVVEQGMVALEMNINKEMPFFLLNMIQAYQSGEFNLLYLQNWTYNNYIKDITYTKQKEANLQAVYIPEKNVAQDNMDNFLKTLHNKDVSLTIELVAPEKAFDKNGKFQPSVIERILTSVNVNLLQNTCPKYLLIQKLIKLLDDPEKDWYANLLLYNLTGKLPSISSENILRINTRIAWLRPMADGGYTCKSSDVKMWKKYFSGLPKS